MVIQQVGRPAFSRTPFLLLTVSIAFALPSRGQASFAAPSATSTKPTAYEVISVKPSKPGNGMSVQTTPDGFSARNTTLWGLIYNAYDVRPNDPIPGLPAWSQSAQFDVDAKMDDDSAAVLQKLPREEQNKHRQSMLQLLLSDRFGLRVHYETRERPIYALVVARDGFKLKEVAPGTIPHGLSWGRGQIDVHGDSIARLAFCLSDMLGRLVVDKTGLTGKYEIALKWTPDEQQGEADAGPPIFTAIQEQLGLKLESTKGPVPLLVVDHLEKPSEN